MSAKKVASRFLLPLEALFGFQAIAWGAAGIIPGSTLQALLGADVARWWAFELCAIGMAQLLVAAIEWRFGRSWPLRLVWRVARVRLLLAFVACMVWVSVCYAAYTEPGWIAVAALWVMAPGMAVAQFYVFIENNKVRHAADENLSTSTLRFQR